MDGVHEGHVPLMLLADAMSIWHDYRPGILASIFIIAVLTQVVAWMRYRWRKPYADEIVSLGERLKTEGMAQEKILKSIPHSVSSSGGRKVLRKPHRKIQGRNPFPSDGQISEAKCLEIQPMIFWSSLTGTTEKHAADLTSAFAVNFSRHGAEGSLRVLSPASIDLSTVELDDYFTSAPKASKSRLFFYILLIPSYNIDTNLNNFLDHLKETHNDFRVDTAPLSNLAGYSVFGFGDREGWPTEEEGFCCQAKEVDKWLAKLTRRKRAYPLGTGNVKGDADVRLREWTDGVEAVLKDLAEGKSLGEGVPGSGDALESEEEGAEEEEDQESGPERFEQFKQQQSGKKKNGSIDDLENLGKGFRGTARQEEMTAIDFTTSKSAATVPDQRKQMVPESSPIHASLTKQGYTIVGSHSGVKICRWTKSALRGRGSCYKHSFYGIASHLCMETTPSLSCSNKCVFCWRHGTNPVGTTWRWQVDPPDAIFAGVKAGHYKKIKMMRGVPGVRAERFEEAMRIRHCALSLVGEPIFYPHINEFVEMLHDERISSFLVCNAQHPDQLAALRRVTQLYVSIDASNKDSLRKIDRPLHRDFWQRFCHCLDILNEKRFEQRTVFRLTLVKGFNVEDEAEGYAALVARALPCFVEVKGVTYCGTSTSVGAGLSMKNVPFYDEITAFVEAMNAALAKKGLDYGIAAEHAHSCCVLLASRRFWREGTWWTRIDYEKFFELLEGGREFTPEEYMARTEDWALWGNGGFDPRDERVMTKGKKKREERERAEACANIEAVVQEAPHGTL